MTSAMLLAEWVEFPLTSAVGKCWNQKQGRPQLVAEGWGDAVTMLCGLQPFGSIGTMKSKKRP